MLYIQTQPVLLNKKQMQQLHLKLQLKEIQPLLHQLLASLEKQII